MLHFKILVTESGNPSDEILRAEICKILQNYVYVKKKLFLKMDIEYNFGTKVTLTDTTINCMSAFFDKMA